MAVDAVRYGTQVEQHGLSSAHKQTIAWVPAGARVLELGCSTGFIAEILRRDKGCTVSGVEVDAKAAADARERGFEVLEGSLESASFRASISTRFPAGFDVVIATDVLEHLSQPAPVLADFVGWLKPGGKAVVAVPNVATWSMRAQLMRGNFTYQDTGLLDRTHLRFFTWHTFHELVQSQGWSVDAAKVDTWELPFAQRLLFDGPLALRAILGPAETETAGLLAAARRQTIYGMGSLIRLHQAVAGRVGERYPNLCAKHISLLLSPPER